MILYNFSMKYENHTIPDESDCKEEDIKILVETEDG